MAKTAASQTASGVIPNLINGVSQQPFNIKFANQGNECVNHYPTLQKQLARRNPLEIQFKLSGVSGLDTSSYLHWYRRDASEAYEIILNGTGIQVYSRTDGSQKTVTMSQPGGDTYHQSADPKTNFYCYTYKDTTWIVNRGVTCAMDTALSSARTPEGLIRVKDAVTGAVYTCKVYVGADTYTATYTAVAADTVSTVATQLRTAINTWITGGSIGGTSAIVENVIHVAHATKVIKIEVSDNRAGTAIASCTTQVQKTADLPPYAPNGYILTVTGSSSNQNSQDQNTLDDIIYRFATDGGGTFAGGVWQEGVAPGIPYAIDPKTMPHQLIRKADGTFEYKQITWEARSVGDTVTNIDPSFIGNKIHSIGLANGRLGINSAGITIFSKSDELNYYDFWRTTIATRLDGDPVTVPVPSAQVNRVYWLQPWNDELMIFGDNLDAAVSWNTSFSQDNISINTPTRFGCSTLVPPIINGASLFFFKDNGEYSALYEYGINPSSALKDATELSEYVSTYIPKNVIKFIGNEKGLMMALCDGARNELYVYNYSIVDSRRLQQAFHKWELDPGITIYNIFQDKRDIGITFSFQGNVFMGKISVAPGDKDTGLPWKVYMDCRISEAFSGVTRVYNSGTNRTTITVPHSYGSIPKVLELREPYTDPNTGLIYPAGKILSIASQTSTTAVVVGDWSTAKLYIGITYSSYFDPARFVTYTQTGDGRQVVMNPWMDLTIHRMAVTFTDTAYLKYQIIKRYGDEVIHEDEVLRLAFDDETQTYDAPSTLEGTRLVAAGVPQDNHYFRFINDSTKPSHLTGLAWMGMYETAND